METKQLQKSRKNILFHPWVITSYFAEGFPYSIVRIISTVFFKDNGASLQAIGLTSLYGLPWVLKFLWSPFVDQFSTKRRWILFTELALTGTLVVMIFGSVLNSALQFFAILFLFLAIISATHDISVDGFYLEHLSKKEQAGYVGFQAMSYRIALIVGGGGLIWISGKFNWSISFIAGSLIIGSIFLFHFFVLPKKETSRQNAWDLFKKISRWETLTILISIVTIAFFVKAFSHTYPIRESIVGISRLIKTTGIPGFITIILVLALVVLALFLPVIKKRLYGSGSFYAMAFVDYLDQPKIGLILSFIVLYRTGESFLLNMAYPFLRDIGITRAQYGIAYGTFGIAASITGGLLGGWLISKYGLKKVIWPFILSQNLLNLLYMFLAFHYKHLLDLPLGARNCISFQQWITRTVLPFMFQPPSYPVPQIDITIVTAFIVIEALGAGLGTAAFMVFIMRTCKANYKAAHMSIATSIMNVSSTMAGVFSGFLATWLGFPLYFGFTFIATIPGMLLIFFLPYLDGKSAQDLVKDTSNLTRS